MQKYPTSSGRAWMPGQSAVMIPGLVRDYDCPKLALLICKEGPGSFHHEKLLQLLGMVD